MTIALRSKSQASFMSVKTGAKVNLIPGKTYSISIKDIFSSGMFVPGEYFSPGCIDECDPSIGYHECTKASTDLKWLLMIYHVRNDDRYPSILQSLNDKGLVAPLAAKITYDGNIMIVDGHHRLAAAVDLDFPSIRVYVGRKSEGIDGLVAADSNYWSGGTINSPWLE